MKSRGHGAVGGRGSEGHDQDQGAGWGFHFNHGFGDFYQRMCNVFNQNIRIPAAYEFQQALREKFVNSPNFTYFSINYYFSTVLTENFFSV